MLSTSSPPKHLPRFETIIAQFTATGFGIGHIPWASGTWGSLLAVFMFLPWASSLPLSTSAQLTASALMLCLFLWGCHASHVAGQALGQADHSAIVWDEMVAMWWVLMLMPDVQPLWQRVQALPIFSFAPVIPAPAMAFMPHIIGITLAFLLFRLFDIVKPYPANWLDRHWHHGFGVMLDDIVAAIYSVAVLWLIMQ